MRIAQSGIVAPLPRHGRVMLYDLDQVDAVKQALMHMKSRIDGLSVVMGLGAPLLQHLGVVISGMSPLPVFDAAVSMPSVPRALWLWLRGDDLGDLFHLSRILTHQLQPAFKLMATRDLFLFHQGRDLSGFHDGTENPQGDQISDTAFIHDDLPGIRGSSCVLVQTWAHRWDVLDTMGDSCKEAIIGRTLKEDIELDDASASAHVRRTAQEDFQPAAFMWRRSMPWVEAMQGGLLFQAFAAQTRPLVAQLRRMSGCDDGLVDHLFRLSRPIDGAFFWCPPMHQGHLDLRALHLG